MKFPLFGIALDEGWQLSHFDKDERLFIFKREQETITIKRLKGKSKWAVYTEIHHPKQGLTKLKRVMSAEELHTIFENTRTHTGVGHHMKIL